MTAKSNRDTWGGGCCIAICLLAPFVFYWPLSIGEGLLGRADAKIEVYPYFFLLGQRIRSGLGLWNQYSAMGARLFASPLSLMGYPPAWLFAPFGSPRAYNMFLLAHYSLATAGMWLFLRELRLDRTASLTGALVLGLSGFMTGHREHAWIIQCVAWTPYGLVFWTRFRRGGGLGPLACFAACLGMTLLTGHFHAAMLVWIVVAAYVLLGERVATFRELCLFAAAGVVAILIGMPQLLPALDLMPTSIRAVLSADVEYRTQGSYNPLAIGMLVAPYLFGAEAPHAPYLVKYWGPHPDLTEMTAYVGIIPLALVVGTLWRARTCRAVRFWWVFALVMSLVAFGRHTPVGRLLAHAPIYKSFRTPARHVFEITFAFSVLAAYGMQWLRREKTSGEQWLRVGVVGLCLLFLIGVLALGAVAKSADAPPNPETTDPVEILKLRFALAGTHFHLHNGGVRVPLVVVTVSLALLLFASALGREWQRHVSYLVVLVVFLDMMTFGRFHQLPDWEWNPTGDETPAEVAWLREACRPRDSRVLPVFNSWEEAHYCALLPNQNLVYGIPSAAYYCVVIPWRYHALFGLAPTGDLEGSTEAIVKRRLLSVLGVSHLVWYGWPYVEGEHVVSGGQTATSLGYELEAEFPGVRILRNPDSLPRVCFVSEVRHCQTADDVRAALHSDSFAPRRTALVEEQIGPREFRAGSDVKITSYESDRVRIRTWNPERGFLVVNDAWDKGWKVAIDGTPAKLYRVNGIARGLVVPAGEHDVVMEYKPFYVAPSLALSALGWAVLGVMCVWGKRDAGGRQYT